MSKSGKVDQHGRLRTVQAGVVLILALLAVSVPAIAEGSTTHEVIEGVGLAGVIAAILGRLWCILYIGGRKSSELVSTGPFSVTRNPLYFFSTVGAVSAGLIFGSLVVASLLGAATYLVFRSTANREAEYLAVAFGSDYQAYAEVTPSFLPNPRLYHDKPVWQFSPPALYSTFRDGLWFLAIFPALEALEVLHLDNTLPVFFKLY
jgi:protein-S-isoprenylcysteine O-methyltransferase Ste14